MDPLELFHATGVAEHAKCAGDFAPDVTLEDAQGRAVRLADLWSRGPLIAVFYRGGWCAYCDLQLRAWREHREAVERLGATLVAISPQTRAAASADDAELGFALLSDAALDAANGFDIAFTLPPELVDVYAAEGTDVPVLNGNGLWVLPVPATYVIDRAGLIRWAFVHADYRDRVAPEQVLDAVARIAR